MSCSYFWGRTSEKSQNANFALHDFCELRFNGVLRNSAIIQNQDVRKGPSRLQLFASYALACISERVWAHSTTTSIVPPQGSGRKEARNVRPDGHHPGLYLSIAHFR
jgi:hypothetical protein